MPQTMMEESPRRPPQPTRVKTTTRTASSRMNKMTKRFHSSSSSSSSFLVVGVVVSLILILQITVTTSMTATRRMYQDIQPDGTIITLRLVGDEYDHHEEDMNGYTVVRDGDTNGDEDDEDGTTETYVVYADEDVETGELIPTTLKVGESDPSQAGLKKKLKPNTAKKMKKKQRKKYCKTHICKDDDEETRKKRNLRNGSTRSKNVEDYEEDDYDNEQQEQPYDYYINSTIPRRLTREENDYHEQQEHQRRRRRTSIVTGTLKNLVVPILFQNHKVDKNKYRPVPTKEELDILFNNNGPHPTYCPTGSIKDVFLENSYGQLTIESTVTNWQLVPWTETKMADGQSGLTTVLHEALIHALNKVDQWRNFADFDLDNDGIIDSITFLHSGYGAEWGGSDQFGTPEKNRIWSHKWFLGWTSKDGIQVNTYHISPALWDTTGSDIGRIGVIAHETGHFLGLPDLYDTDSSGGHGIGAWGLMADSWGFDGSQLYPPHLSAWSKMKLGWLVPQNVQHGMNYLSASELQTPAGGHPQVIKISNGYPTSDEYLLIENRQQIGFDANIPQGGLAIWHIDESTGLHTEGYPGTDGQWTGGHYRIALLQADGRYNLERGDNVGGSQDLFHAGYRYELVPSTESDPSYGPFPNTDSYAGGIFTRTGNEILSISSSGNIMSFMYNDPTAPTDPPTDIPTGGPTDAPSLSPSGGPTAAPTDAPSISPSGGPTGAPTSTPSSPPTGGPTATPTSPPTGGPTLEPTTPPTSPTTDPPTIDTDTRIGGGEVTYDDVAQALMANLFLNGHNGTDEITLAEWDRIDSIVDALFPTTNVRRRQL